MAAETRAEVVLMHNRGRSRDMYREANYTDVAGEVAGELTAAITRATDAGVPRDAIIIDPGLGFSKRAEHSYEVLARLAPAAVARIRARLSAPSVAAIAPRS